MKRRNREVVSAPLDLGEERPRVQAHRTFEIRLRTENSQQGTGKQPAWQLQDTTWT